VGTEAGAASEGGPRLSTYDVVVTPDDRWLMVSVPALGLLTQARHPAEVETMARSLIATSLDVSHDSFEVQIRQER
jgi:hypothetical protein